MKIKIVKTLKIRDIICPNSRKISLNTLKPTKNPPTVESVPKLHDNSKIAVNTSPNLMMIPSGGSFCFLFFIMCIIFMTFF